MGNEDMWNVYAVSEKKCGRMLHLKVLVEAVCLAPKIYQTLGRMKTGLVLVSNLFSGKCQKTVFHDFSKFVLKYECQPEV